MIICCWALAVVLKGVEPGTIAPAVFIFGDSVADVGNNNYLPFSLVKANFLPNGIDYNGRYPTGRFCNGRTVFDFISNRLKFPMSLPYLAPKTQGAAILQGVNYASAGCGILNETSNADNCLSFSTQLRYHENTLLSSVEQLGIANAQSFLSSSLYFVAIGSNDFLGNYVRNTADTKKYSPSAFNNLLVSSLSQELTRLYDQNARKIVLAGLCPLGCIPSERLRIKNEGCNDVLNGWILQLNAALKGLVQQLNSKLPNAKFTFVNPYNLFNQIIQNPSKYGFNVTTQACCGSGRLRAQIPCLPLSNYCSNRGSYIFWDEWHTTEAANELLASSLLSGSSSVDVGPWSIQQLASVI